MEQLDDNRIKYVGNKKCKEYKSTNRIFFYQFTFCCHPMLILSESLGMTHNALCLRRLGLRALKNNLMNA